MSLENDWWRLTSLGMVNSWELAGVLVSRPALEKHKEECIGKHKKTCPAASGTLYTCAEARFWWPGAHLLLWLLMLWAFWKKFKWRKCLCRQKPKPWPNARMVFMSTAARWRSTEVNKVTGWKIPSISCKRMWLRWVRAIANHRKTGEGQSKSRSYGL